MALRSRELSAVEHVTDALDRLAADPYNTVITLDATARSPGRGARRRAGGRAVAGAAARRRGRGEGPHRRGRAADAAAARWCCADAPPAAADAPVVARLLEAGAVVVAKLHTHEFAYGPTGDVAATGPARNPHDPSRITGGSSSGSAAAVAAGHVPLALGTDTGASVRTPAALCGVVGLKPAYGHLSAEGAFPLAESLDTSGLLTADVHSRVGRVGRARPAGRHRRRHPAARGRRACGSGCRSDAYWRPADPSIGAVVGGRGGAAAGGGRGGRRGGHADDRRAGRDVPGDRRGGGVGDARRRVRRRRRSCSSRSRGSGWRRTPTCPRARTSTPCAPGGGWSAAMRAALDVDVLVLPTTRLRATPIGAETVGRRGTCRCARRCWR